MQLHDPPLHESTHYADHRTGHQEVHTTTAYAIAEEEAYAQAQTGDCHTPPLPYQLTAAE
jgi:hypothetical protein